MPHDPEAADLVQIRLITADKALWRSDDTWVVGGSVVQLAPVLTTAVRRALIRESSRWRRAERQGAGVVEELSAWTGYAEDVRDPCWVIDTQEQVAVIRALMRPSLPVGVCQIFDVALELGSFEQAAIARQVGVSRARVGVRLRDGITWLRWKLRVETQELPTCAARRYVSLSKTG